MELDLDINDNEESQSLLRSSTIQNRQQVDKFKSEANYKPKEESLDFVDKFHSGEEKGVGESVAKRGRFEKDRSEPHSKEEDSDGKKSPIIPKSRRKRSLCTAKDEWFLRTDSNGHKVDTYLRPVHGDKFKLLCAADGATLSCKTRGFSAIQACLLFILSKLNLSTFYHSY